ncbi:MAG: hypothetical protein ABIJ57_06240 [Pseudomonadota bacterium]
MVELGKENEFSSSGICLCREPTAFCLPPIILKTKEAVFGFSKAAEIARSISQIITINSAGRALQDHNERLKRMCGEGNIGWSQGPSFASCHTMWQVPFINFGKSFEGVFAGGWRSQFVATLDFFGEDFAEEQGNQAVTFLNSNKFKNKLLTGSGEEYSGSVAEGRFRMSGLLDVGYAAICKACSVDQDGFGRRNIDARFTRDDLGDMLDSFLRGETTGGEDRDVLLKCLLFLMERDPDRLRPQITGEVAGEREFRQRADGRYPSAFKPIFIDIGNGYEIEFQGESRVLRKNKGLQYLKILVERADQDLQAVELKCLVEGRDPKDLPPPKFLSSGNVKDPRLVARLKDVQCELEEATAFSDTDRVATLRGELGMLLDRVGDSRSRRRLIAEDNPGPERVRKSVHAAISRSLVTLEEIFPAVGRHFRNCVTNGHICRYNSFRPFN